MGPPELPLPKVAVGAWWRRTPRRRARPGLKAASSRTGHRTGPGPPASDAEISTVVFTVVSEGQRLAAGI
jgi:hypothetical protein